MPGDGRAAAIGRNLKQDGNARHLPAMLLIQVGPQAKKLIASKGASPCGRGKIGVKICAAFDELGIFLQEGEELVFVAKGIAELSEGRIRELLFYG